MNTRTEIKLKEALSAAVAALTLVAVPCLAQDEGGAETGWEDVAELSFFSTGGNSEAQTLSLRNTLTKKLEGATFSLAAGAVRAETTTTTRSAIGTPAGFTLEETSDTALTAENYFLRGRYDRQINEKLFWFGGLGWDKNEFAGIKNRTTAFAGMGHKWHEDDVWHLFTDYGVTFTDQEDVSGFSDSFAGVRFSYDYLRQLNGSTSFASLLILDGNVDETSDYRADFVNSLSVGMSDRLALKVSLQLLYDNLPALTEVPIFDSNGGAPSGTALVPLDDLDSILTVSLVGTF